MAAGLDKVVGLGKVAGHVNYSIFMLGKAFRAFLISYHPYHSSLRVAADPKGPKVDGIACP